MPGGDRKIHEHPNAGTNSFAHRPQDAGRPKKLYSQHIAEIKELGYVAPTYAEYYEMIGLLLSMEEEDLKTFAKDETRPYWIRLIVVDLNSKASRQKMMSDYRDWLYGRAKQSVETDTKVTLQDVETWASKFRTQSSPTNKSE